MVKEYRLDDDGCRLLSSRQWKQLLERVFARPEDTAKQLFDHYAAEPPKFRTGRLAFQPTEAEWEQARIKLAKKRSSPP